jgi:hypothetical protein
MVSSEKKKFLSEPKKKKNYNSIRPRPVQIIWTLFPALHRACVLLRGNVAQLEAALQEAVQ